MIFALLLPGGNAFSLDRYGPHSVDYSDVSDFVVMGRPVNIQGLTGLLITNSAYTRAAGEVAIGLSASLEDSSDPNYSIVLGALTATIGLTDRFEVGLKGKMVATNVGSDTTREVGQGDTDVLLKWRISSQGDTLPAFALGFAYTFPTGDSTKGFNEVEQQGIKLMLIATSENKILDDSFIGVYFEGQAVYNDQIHRVGAVAKEEAYGVINAGLLFPISDDNRVQLGLEYNKVFKKDIVTLNEGNYTAFTPSLRYAGDIFYAQAGVQFLSVDTTSPPRADKRLIGSLGLIF